jgi:hypothetical protein
MISGKSMFATRRRNDEGKHPSASDGLAFYDPKKLARQRLDFDLIGRSDETDAPGA